MNQYNQPQEMQWVSQGDAGGYYVMPTPQAAPVATGPTPEEKEATRRAKLLESFAGGMLGKNPPAYTFTPATPFTNYGYEVPLPSPAQSQMFAFVNPFAGLMANQMSPYGSLGNGMAQAPAFMPVAGLLGGSK